MGDSIAGPRAKDRYVAGGLLAYTAVALTALEYFALPTRVQARLTGRPWGSQGPVSLEAGVTWALLSVGAYLVLPWALLMILGFRPRDLGLAFRGFARHLPVYLGLFLLMVPALWHASGQPEFTRTYPFVSEARRDLGVLLRFEAAYIAQFFALEAFFRGALLFGLERAVGRLAIPIMVVPYTMIHFHKPVLECFGAAIAGFALGYLALRYRSFLGGFLLHSLVALSMDFLSAKAAGLF